VRQGVLVSDVVDESPAQKAGMKRRDVITEYGKEKVTNSDQLRDMVISTFPGKEVKILIIRDGRERWIEVKIGKKPKYSRIGKEETWRDFQFPDLDWLKQEFSSEGIKEKLEKLEEQIEKLKQRLDSD